MKTVIQYCSKWLFIGAGATLAYLKPAIPFLLVCTFAVLLDCYSAWRLSRRVARKYPELSDGKFKSKYARRIFHTLFNIYSVVILTYMIEQTLLYDFHLHLPQITSAVFCFVQIWSFLENESSENPQSWAIILQKVMVDKAKRHFDIDIEEELKDNKDNTNQLKSN